MENKNLSPEAIEAAAALCVIQRNLQLQILRFQEFVKEYRALLPEDVACDIAGSFEFAILEVMPVIADVLQGIALTGAETASGIKYD